MSALTRCGVILVLSAVSALAPAAAADTASAASEDASMLSAQYTSPAQLSRWARGDAPLHIVDLRAEHAYEAYHVPGAIRLSPIELRTLSAWQNERLVLVGSGAAYRSLEALQAQLIEEGFADVWLLDGGTAFWKKQARVASNLTLGADEFDLRGDAARWILLNLADTEIATDFSLEIRDGTDADARELQADLSKALERRADGVTNVLVVASEPGLAQQVAEQLSPRLRANVFALNGGWLAWEESAKLGASIAKADPGNAFAIAGGQCW